MSIRAAVLSIGDELTLGQVAESNARWISQECLALGVRVVQHRTVDDDRDEIARGIVQLAAIAEVLVVTGGLGPTDDDLTREALAQAMGSKALIEDDRALEMLRARFESRGREMPQMNARQALRPTGAQCIDNPNGTAPGLMARIDQSTVYCLPGPPNEMRPMFHAVISPALQARVDAAERQSLRTCAIHSCGLAESVAAERIRAFMQRDANPLVGTTASGAVVTARIRASGTAAHDGRFEQVCDEIERAWSPYCFGRDLTTLAESLGQVLRDRGEHVVTAESCTAGGIAQFITTAAGSSGWFRGGWITYSNGLKHAMLGVPREMLHEHGAVSPQVACSMAVGAAERAGVRFAVSATGIAGPDGGTVGKPVGTVWIAVADLKERDAAHRARARCFRLSGDRETVRERSVRIAAQLVRFSAMGNPDIPVLWEVPFAIAGPT